MKTKKQNLLTNPDLVKEWHFEKNAPLTPKDVTAGSGRKIWWKCSIDPTHEWQAQICNRNNGTGCPFCSGKKACIKNDLAHRKPNLVKEWHYVKNAYLLPSHFTPGSGKKVWWKCSKDPSHEWQAMISNRSRGEGCPYCRGKRVHTMTSLATLYPNIAKEWNYEKNHPLTPKDVTRGSSEKVWWKCSKNPSHEWQAKIGNRSRGEGCTYCSGHNTNNDACEITEHSLLAQEWSTRNFPLNLSNFAAKSNKKVWWRCSKEPSHEWQARICDRTRGSRCPFCSGRKAHPTTSLATLYPHIAKEWDYEKNHPLTPKDVTRGSSEKVWWKCSKNPSHIWQAQVHSRTGLGTRCPYCYGSCAPGTQAHKVSLQNSLEYLHPDLSQEWNYERNVFLAPKDVTAGSSRKMWWRCSIDPVHEWQAKICDRSKKKSGCPYCCGHKVHQTTSLAALHPQIAKEWDSEKNGAIKPEDVTSGSNKSMYWICSKDQHHRWQARISDRSRGSGCPYCNSHNTHFSNSLTEQKPELAKEWLYERNSPIAPEQVLPGSNKKVWWRCSKEPLHEWQARICDRSRGSGCPFCCERPRYRPAGKTMDT